METQPQNPVILIVRDPKEWPSDEFATLFGEEGYNTRDVDTESPPTAVKELKPFGVIGTGIAEPQAHSQYCQVWLETFSSSLMRIRMLLPTASLFMIHHRILSIGTATILPIILYRLLFTSREHKLQRPSIRRNRFSRLYTWINILDLRIPPL
jgi:hypothetical protein